MTHPKNKIEILADYGDVMRFKLSAVVTLSAVTGYFLCGNIFTHDILFLIPGIFLLSAGSSALNQYAEADLDRRMTRTANRPLPAGRKERGTVLAFSLFLLVTGSLLLLITGLLPFIFGILNILLYNFIYTPIKCKSLLALVPGSLTGAITPLIGYSTSCNEISDPSIVLFSLFMFVWQFPHTWLIQLRYGKEFKVAGIPTLQDLFHEKKIKWFILTGIILSTSILLFSGLYSTNKMVQLILIIVHSAFYLLFYRYLFFGNAFKKAFYLLNAFTLLIMILLIVKALLPLCNIR